tara:strand:- start:47 stop:949 length:903 start_codon:yes stop_codon:yes gene_type:complete
MALQLVRKATKAAAKAVRDKLTPAQKAARAKERKAAAAKREANKVAATKPKATEKGVRLADKPETQEGMALDPITGGSVRAASDVDKGKAGKVTRSPEPGFLQSQRTAGSRAAAKTKAELSAKVRDGKATKAEKEQLKKLRSKDVKDEQSARAKAGQSNRGKKKEVDDFAKAIDRKTGEINEASFNKLTKNQQQSLIRDIEARFEGPRLRRIKAQLEEVLIKYGRSTAGESGVGPRKGGPKGMSGSSARITDIDDGVSKGRGGLDFNKGGNVTKSRMGKQDFRYNKGGLLLSSVDNRKKK